MALTAHTTAYTGDINDWALETYHFGPFSVGIASGTVVLGTDGSYPLITFAETVDIEKISIRMTTLAAADADRIRFDVATSTTAPSSGTAITALEPLTTAANAALAANKTVDVPFLSTAPQINLPSGTALVLTTDGTIVSAAGLMITVTTRKSPTRRDTSTDAQKVDKSRYFYTSKV
jgi:hypothetical protein